jgi:hypothetical protein
MELNMSTVEDLISQVQAQDFSKAGPTFNELLGNKLADAMEAEKIRISNQVYNAAPEDEEEAEEEAETDTEVEDDAEDESEEEENN